MRCSAKTTKTWAYIGLLCLATSILTLLMNGCYMSHERDEELGIPFHSWPAIQAAVNAWADAGLPTPARCEQELMDIAVEFVPATELDCSMLEDRVDGCYASHRVTILLPDTIDPAKADAATVHHAIHWLHECAWGTLDHMHTGTVPRDKSGFMGCVWSGGPECLESKAVRSL